MPSGIFCALYPSCVPRWAFLYCPSFCLSLPLPFSFFSRIARSGLFLFGQILQITEQAFRMHLESGALRARRLTAFRTDDRNDWRELLGMGMELALADEPSRHSNCREKVFHNLVT
jgi:hypothetical protein